MGKPGIPDVDRVRDEFDEPEITLAERSEHWKDRAAGYHRWRVVFVCATCYQRRVEHIMGTLDQAREFYRVPRCERCNN